VSSGETLSDREVRKTFKLQGGRGGRGGQVETKKNWIAVKMKGVRVLLHGINPRGSQGEMEKWNLVIDRNAKEKGSGDSADMRGTN